MVRESAVNTITRPQKRDSFERALLKARNLHRALKGSFKGALQSLPCVEYCDGSGEICEYYNALSKGPLRA